MLTTVGAASGKRISAYGSQAEEKNTENIILPNHKGKQKSLKDQLDIGLCSEPVIESQ